MDQTGREPHKFNLTSFEREGRGAWMGDASGCTGYGAKAGAGC